MSTRLDQKFQHPDSLRVFFATEMWERYGFYVVQSLLALYLALHYHWPDKQIYALVGSFTALTYLSPVVGGWIADHLLGQKKTILLGAVVLCLCYLVLTIINHEKILTMALAGIAVGTGLLKPNISSLLGNQYPKDSSRREAGFTVFYMGITSGIILGTTLPSQLNYYFGWSLSFASAALGMVISFLTFFLGIKRYQILDYRQVSFQWTKALATAVLLVGLWCLSNFILFYPKFADLSFLGVVIVSSTYLLFTATQESPAQSKQTLTIGLLCLISIIFWAFYFQMFLSLTLFIARVVRPTFLGISFPPPYYVAIQSIGMLVFGYFIAQKKQKHAATLFTQGMQTNNKFLMSMGLMCLSYLLITALAWMSDSNALLLPIYFIPAYLLISLAELLLSPVGLAAITSLACRHKVSTMMGIFFVSLGIGAFLSGKLAILTAVSPDNLTVSALKIHYAQSFSKLLLILILTTGVSVLLNRVIKKLLMAAERA